MYWTVWLPSLAPCGRGKCIGQVGHIHSPLVGGVKVLGGGDSPRPLWERVQSCLNRQAKATNAGEG